jgi:hypothetical protein
MKHKPAGLEERLEAARAYFRDHHANVAPDRRFADRVAASLRPAPAEALGWAAIRLLPAALALTMVLIWLALQPGANAQPVSQSPATEDPIAWVLEQDSTQPQEGVR